MRLPSVRPAPAQRPWPVLACLLLLLPAAAAAQHDDGSIFQRFRNGVDLPDTRQLLLEIPAAVQPQTHREADIVENGGVQFNLAFRPHGRLYVSQGYNFTKLEWKPAEPDLRTVRVLAFDITRQLNASVYRAFVMGLGIGVGLMDGLIIESERRFETRLEPYIPLHLFFGLPLGGSAMVGIKLAQSSFFGPGPVLSVTRMLVGLGFSY